MATFSRTWMRAVSRPVGTAIMDPDLAYLDEPEEAASDVDTGDDGEHLLCTCHWLIHH